MRSIITMFLSTRRIHRVDGILMALFIVIRIGIVSFLVQILKIAPKRLYNQFLSLGLSNELQILCTKASQIKIYPGFTLLKLFILILNPAFQSAMINESSSDMFAMLKQRFPHLNINTINPEASFSENLQMIISQIGMPHDFESFRQITHMKQAVDSQQLKIQKNLINTEDNALGQITNKTIHKKEKKQKGHVEYEIEEEVYWQQRQNSIGGDLMGDIMSEIWEVDHMKHRDWFNH